MDAIWQNIFMGLARPRVVSIVGGGGKSSLLYYLWQGCKAMDWSVIGTTTTKFAEQEWVGEEFTFINEMDEGSELLLKKGGKAYMLASRHKEAPKQRVVGPEPEWIDRWSAQAREYFYLVEADGSRGRSLKVHKHSEPALPQSTALTIAVMGVDCWQKTLDAQWVQHVELLSGAYDGKYQKKIGAELFADLAEAKGYFHNTPAGSKCMVYLNKVESKNDWQAAEEIAACMHGRGSVLPVIAGSLHNRQFRQLQ